jgi:hypothetical protein
VPRPARVRVKNRRRFIMDAGGVWEFFCRDPGHEGRTKWNGVTKNLPFWKHIVSCHAEIHDDDRYP